MTTRLEALNKAKGSFDEIDFIHNEQPKCPHCGRTIYIAAHDLYSIYEEGEHEIDCPHCEMSLLVSTRVHHTFNTDRQPN